MFPFLMNILYLRDKIAVTYILNYSLYYMYYKLNSNKRNYIKSVDIIVYLLLLN